MKKFKLFFMLLICGVAVFQFMPKVLASPSPPILSPEVQMTTFLHEFKNLASQTKYCDTTTLFKIAKAKTGMNFWELKKGHPDYIGDNTNISRDMYHGTLRSLLKNDHIGNCESCTDFIQNILGRIGIENLLIVMLPDEQVKSGHICNIYLDPITGKIWIADMTMQIAINVLNPEDENDRQKIIYAKSKWFGDRQDILEGAEYAMVPMERYIECIEKHFKLKKENMKVGSYINGEFCGGSLEKFNRYMREKYGTEVIS